MTTMLFVSCICHAQTYTFSTSGTWTCPAGVTTITVQCWGAGGAGGSANITGTQVGAGGGGGGYTEKTYTVVPGTVYPVTVGIGGIGDATNTGAAAAGGNSLFNNDNTTIARGGLGGYANGGTAGTGQNDSTQNAIGGNGSTGSVLTLISGAGGGGAGQNNNGGNAIGATGGLMVCGGGGAGGNAVSGNSRGNNGNNYGAGGGGACKTGGTNRAGGNGGNGLVVINIGSPATVQITALSANACSGGTITISGSNFTGITASRVTINGNPVQSITSFTSSQIIAVTNTPVTGVVRVVTNEAQAYSCNLFTVYTLPTASISGTSAVCLNSSSPVITFTGANGTAPYTFIYKINGGSNQTLVTSSSSSSATVTQATTTAGTYTYTLVSVSDANCSQLQSGSFSVTVNSASVGGNIAGGSTLCQGSNSGTLTLSGNTGNVTRWESSTNAGVLWTSISNTSTSQSYSNLSQATLYRAVVQSGVCPSANSATASMIITIPYSATISYAGSPFCSSTGTALTTFSGSIGGVFSASPTVGSINAATGAVDLSSTNPGKYTISYTLPAIGGCPVYTTATTLLVNPNVWKGTINGYWNDPLNWAGQAIPTGACPITIPAGTPFSPTVPTGTTVNLQNLNVNAGATLTLVDCILQVGGNINNAGTINAAAATIEVIGSSAQTLGSNTFLNNAVKNLIISAPTVNLAGPLSIYGTLSFSGVGQTLVTNDNLTLKSSASGTANIAAIPVDAAGIALDSITGKVTVERYISAAKAWRLLAAPANCTQTIKQTWQENQTANSTTLNGYGIQMSGNRTTWDADGFDMRTPASASIKTYVPATDTWTSVTSTYNPINSAAAYMVLIRGDRTVNAFGQAPTSTVLRTQSTVATGKQPTQTIAAGQFTLVANPYASAIDFQEITRTGGVQTAFYVWDPKLGGGLGGYQTIAARGATPSSINSYSIVPGGGSYAAGNKLIESGEAFFVTATGTAGTITINEASKVSGSNLVSRDLSEPGSLRINLNRMSGSTATLVDGVINMYDSSYSAGVDGEDIRKISTVGESLSIKTDNIYLAADKRPLPGNNDTLALALGTLSRLTYQLEFTAENLDNSSAAFLVDRFLNTVTPIDLTTTSNIPFTVTDAAGSYAADRFAVTFNAMKLLPVMFTSIAATRNNDKTITVRWSVENEADIKEYIVERSSDGRNFKAMKSKAPATSGTQHLYTVVDIKPLASDNFYRIRSVDMDGRTLYSNIVKVSNIVTPSTINVYPNPVENKTMNIYFDAQTAGTEYTLSLYGNNGQLVHQTTTTVSGSTDVKTVMLNQSIAAGKYTLVASNSSMKTSVSLLIK